MTKDQLHEFIEVELATFPDRTSGNEVNVLLMAERLRPVASAERQVLIEALRDFLDVRIPNGERQPTDAIREARLK